MNVLKISLLLITLSSVLYMNYPVGRIFLAIFTVTLMFSLFLMKNTVRIHYNPLMFLLFYFFILTSILSALIKSDIELLIGALTLGVIYTSLNLIYPSIMNWQSNYFLYRAVLIIHIPLIYFPLISGIYFPYKGIFENSNSFGIAALMLYTALLSKLTSYIYSYIKEEKHNIKPKELMFLLLALSSLMLLIIYSGSRTSFVAAIVLIVVAILILVIQCLLHIKKHQVVKTFKIICWSAFMLSVVFVVFPIKEKFEQIILYKFQLKSGNGDILSGRGQIWETTIKEAKMFGHGRDYFSSFDHGAHNTFISLIGQYGWLPSLSFVIFLVISIFSSYLYCFRAIKDEYRYLPLFSLLIFLLLSTAEGMLFKTPMIISFASLGSMILADSNKRSKVNKSERNNLKKINASFKRYKQI